MSADALRALDVAEGSVVEIVGRQRTAAIALRLHPCDRGAGVVRIDGLQRANANAAIGDSVKVRRATALPARRVELTPVRHPGPALAPSESPEALRLILLDRALVAGDCVATSTYRHGAAGAAEDLRRVLAGEPALPLQEVRLRVASTVPDGVVRIVGRTEVVLLPGEVDARGPRRTAVTYDDLGGVADALRQVREMIELPLRHPELFQRLGIDPPRGVLLYGPPGSGKTLLARAVANEADASFFHIGGPEIMAPYQGESEERLRAIFHAAAEQAPSIVFMDEIDSIAPKREAVTGETERRVVAQLLALMDGLEPRRDVIVVGATNRIDDVDEALRRPGRFDREVFVGVPNQYGRREILAVHTRGMPLADDVDLDEFARKTYGFVGADLAALAREAAIDVLRRHLPDVDLDGSAIPDEALEELRVTRYDFGRALRRVQPSAMREIMIQVPDVGWDDVGGLDDAKRVLRDGVELPLKFPDAFRRLGVKPSRGFLLFGPPGTGKTLLAKAVATQAQANFIAAKSSDLLSKWYGESERQVSRLFARAKQVAPAVLFMDEIDALVPQRGGAGDEAAVTGRVVNTMLAEMDGLEELEGVVVIGATNRPTLIDPALLRPGRFDELIYTPVPDCAARLRILRAATAKMPLARDVDLPSLAERTQGCTGADLTGLARRAALHALREGPLVAHVSMALFEQALRETRPSVTPEMEREYEQLLEDLKRECPRGARRIGFAVDAGGRPPGAGAPPLAQGKEAGLKRAT
jgi:transitional endoplasmic reticulum ATPase